MHQQLELLHLALAHGFSPWRAASPESQKRNSKPMFSLNKVPTSHPHAVACKDNLAREVRVRGWWWSGGGVRGEGRVEGERRRRRKRVVLVKS